MLISLEYRFIFVANFKTGSTSIEDALGPYCEIKLPRTEWGKHITIHDIQTGFSHVFSHIPLSEFRIFAVMREPIDWLYSLYRSHMSPIFDNTELTSIPYSFTEFLKIWGSQNPEQMIPQYNYILGANGNIVVDFIANFHQLQHDFNIFCSVVGLPEIILPFHNLSIEKQGSIGLSIDDYNYYRNIYSKDYKLLDLYSGKILNTDEKNQFSSSFLFDYDGELSILRGQHREINHRSISREDVIIAYKTILGRDPENERVIQDHLAYRITIAQLHEIFRNCEEYAALSQSRALIPNAAHHFQSAENDHAENDGQEIEPQEHSALA